MKTSKQQIKFLKSSEIQTIIKKIKLKREIDYRDKALIEVLFSTGLRIAECLALPTILFFKSGPGTLETSIVGKGGYQRVIYFSPTALKAIQAYLAIRKNDRSLLLFSFIA